MHTRSFFLGLLLTGCHSSLISGANLESLLGVTPLPVDPAWEVRWYAGAEAQISIGCELIDAELIEDDVYWEDLYGFPPNIEQPPVWVVSEAESYRYAIALLTLVDAERYISPEESQEGDEYFESLDMWRGVWGGVSSNALLFAEGDLESMAEDALLLPDALDLVQDESIWLGMLPELASVKEDLAGALYPLPNEDELDLFDVGLKITPTEYLSDASYEVLSGEILGDGVSVGCEE